MTPHELDFLERLEDCSLRRGEAPCEQTLARISGGMPDPDRARRELVARDLEALPGAD